MLNFKHTQEEKEEIINLSKTLKLKGYREETNFSLLSTCELMVMYKKSKI